MYYKGKYLIGEIGAGFTAPMVAVCFPETVGHDDVGRRLFQNDTIIAGGFFHIDHEGNVQVYDKSVSMNVSSRPGEDEKFIYRALGMGDKVE